MSTVTSTEMTSHDLAATQASNEDSCIGSTSATRSDHDTRQSQKSKGSTDRDTPRDTKSSIASKFTSALWNGGKRVAGAFSTVENALADQIISLARSYGNGDWAGILSHESVAMQPYVDAIQYTVNTARDRWVKNRKTTELPCHPLVYPPRPSHGVWAGVDSEDLESLRGGWGQEELTRDMSIIFKGLREIGDDAADTRDASVISSCVKLLTGSDLVDDTTKSWSADDWATCKEVDPQEFAKRKAAADKAISTHADCQAYVEKETAARLNTSRATTKSYLRTLALLPVKAAYANKAASYLGVPERVAAFLL